VFVECGAAYDRGGDDAWAPVGETVFVTGEAERSVRQVMGGIVAHADLTGAALDDVLDAHEEAAHGRFRGIRHAGSHALHPEVLRIPGRAPAGLYADQTFRAGVARLGERGLSYDTWHYHYQNRDFLDLARSVPGTTMVLDHFGTPLGVGPYASQREHIFGQWTTDIADIARCENVVAKIGGLAMPDNGFGWHTADRPPTSDEFIEAQGRYYLHTIEQFGPDRCMFESNFPVDRLSLSYRTVWNAFKKLVADFSADERDAMLRGTAARVYRLG
jgi:predicted TIM-barrel fold metal-dependent hydrolase